jgi:hypothetical protein
MIFKEKLDFVEKKVNEEFFHVLSKIKGLSLKTPRDSAIKYNAQPSFIGGGSLDHGLILKKLEEEGIIKIIRSYGEYE